MAKKSKRFSPPALIVGTIFLVVAVAILAAAVGAVQGVQNLFTEASGTRSRGTFYVPSQAQKAKGCVPRPTCLDEQIPCKIKLPAGVVLCEKTENAPTGTSGMREQVKNPRMVPAPSSRPIVE